MVMISFRSLHAGQKDLEAELEKTKAEYETRIAELERITNLLLKKQGSLANRTRPKVPKFPKSLERIGLHPPSP